ncbi:hypothetical protein MMC12_006545 [Toensbergia leucococca]|nr:hypothetical protein [Toensbergia leucococca]
MPSRGPNDALALPRRAKSSSSFKRSQYVSESNTLNPDAANPYALTAAFRAFERTAEHTTPPKDSDKSDIERQTIATTEIGHGEPVETPSSVRFTGPAAVPIRHHSITRREAGRHETSTRSQGFRLQRNGSTIDCSERVVTALPRLSEHSIEDHDSPTHSPYHKIRKAKSMFAARKVPSLFFTDSKLPNQFDVQSRSTQPFVGSNQQTPLHNFQVKRSVSLLRGKSDYLPSSARQYASQDAAVQIARDQYLRQLEQQRLREQPSILTLGKRRKSQKAFRRTVRTSSTNSYGNAVASPDQPPIEPERSKGFGSKARSLSLSLKNKLKRVFHRNPDAEPVLPTQHVDASRPHFRDYTSKSSSVDQEYRFIPSPDGEIIRRVNSRGAALGNAPFFHHNGSRADSIGSARSVDGVSIGKSRVTSWTNSSAATTLTTHQLMEKKRLSIIQETGGPHESGKSCQHGPLTDCYAVFQSPIRHSSAGGRITGPVDSQRVFSALQKRIDENNRLASQEEPESDTDTVNDHSTPYVSDVTYISSQRVATTGVNTPNTAEEALLDVRGFKSSEPVIFESSKSDRSTDVFKLSTGKDESLEAHESVLKLRLGLTPQQIAERNEYDSSRTNRSLRDMRSVIFPQSVHIECSKISPYQRALHSNAEDELVMEEATHTIKRSKILGVLQPRSVTGSDSIYSRTTSGNTPMPSESSLSLTRSESNTDTGTSYITASRSARYEYSTVPYLQPNDTFIDSGKDWKNRLTSRLPGLENAAAQNTKLRDDEIVNDIGHRRENAQIDEDDVRIGGRQYMNLMPMQPLTSILSNVMSQSVPKTSSTAAARHPLLEIVPPQNLNTVEDHTKVVINRCPAHINKSSCSESERHLFNRLDRTSSSIHSKTSQTSLVSQSTVSGLKEDLPFVALAKTSQLKQTLGTTGSCANAQSEPPAKTVSRYSPERTARLRRMQSSNAIGQRDTVCGRFGLAQRHHQQENQIINNVGIADPVNEDHFSDGTGLLEPTTIDDQGTRSQNVVERFLNSHRNDMRISEEIGSDSAFL